MSTQRKYDFLILGGSGMQGRIAARDLLESGHSVFLADLYDEGAKLVMDRFPLATYGHVDVRSLARTERLIRKVGAPVVINCTEGDWDLRVYQACLKAGVHVIDLGSEIPMTREQLEMDGAFRKAGLIAITGCGSTPGINDVMLRYASDDFGSVRKVDVGFAWNSNMKQFVVPFSIESIIEEFTEPAPVIEQGKWLEKQPFENVVMRRIRAVGRQACFPVRHAETYTFSLQHRRNGLRDLTFYAGFPEHSVSVIRLLITLGFGKRRPILIEGHPVRPIDALTRVLTRLRMPEGYTETENLWVRITGTDKKDAPLTTLMECIVPPLKGWEDAGCNVDTGMPASIIAQMIAGGRIRARGSFSAGPVVPPEPFFAELGKRGIRVYQDGRRINVVHGRARKAS